MISFRTTIKYIYSQQRKFNCQCVLQSAASGVDSLQVTEQAAVSENPVQQGVRVTKAQRRRDKKAEKDKEREALIAKQEELNKFGPRHLEEVKIKQLLALRKLALHDVASDGNWQVFFVLFYVNPR